MNRKSGTARHLSGQSFTEKQGQYLAFIYAYSRMFWCSPAEADMQRHFRVSPPSVHQMVLTLERAGLIRHKLDASPVLRTALEAGNWHLVLWPYLRAWLERDPLELDGLEPFLGLEPAVERRGEQLGLFDRPDARR